EQILPDALRPERILADDQRRDPFEDLLDRAHGFGAALGQERTVGLADPDEAGVRREPDDELAHAADRRGGRAYGLRQGRGEEVRVERGDLHLVTSSARIARRRVVLLSLCAPSSEAASGTG